MLFYEDALKKAPSGSIRLGLLTFGLVFAVAKSVETFHTGSGQSVVEFWPKSVVASGKQNCIAHQDKSSVQPAGTGSSVKRRRLQICDQECVGRNGRIRIRSEMIVEGRRGPGGDLCRRSE
ncbi:hypothetical protein pipiens_010720 [Culex pipiens pipiens]|uniref:Uncharacterized protein n=1 Tax=Culex pipiens pipiens TaxID=38569 RepID=A0ABD1D980_CULPP